METAPSSVATRGRGETPTFIAGLAVQWVGVCDWVSSCLAAWKRIRIRVLRDVAWGPSVETGASVPGYSGGFASCAAVSDPGFL